MLNKFKINSEGNTDHRGYTIVLQPLIYILTQYFKILIQQVKLVKLFSKQLVAKAKIPVNQLTNKVSSIPSLKQWLQVVGISQQSVELLCIKFESLEALKELSDDEIRKGFTDCSAKEEEYRRLACALQNVKRYTGIHPLNYSSIKPIVNVIFSSESRSVGSR